VKNVENVENVENVHNCGLMFVNKLVEKTLPMSSVHDVSMMFLVEFDVFLGWDVRAKPHTVNRTLHLHLWCVHQSNFGKEDERGGKYVSLTSGIVWKRIFFPIKSI